MSITRPTPKVYLIFQSNEEIVINKNQILRPGGYSTSVEILRKEFKNSETLLKNIDEKLKENVSWVNLLHSFYFNIVILNLL